MASRSAAGSASGVAGDASTVQKGRIVPKNAAERRAAAAKGLLRRTGRAVKTAAELEKEKVEQAKLIAEKKKQMAQELRAKQRQVAAEKKVAAKQARVQVSAAAAVATRLEQNQETVKMSGANRSFFGLCFFVCLSDCLSACQPVRVSARLVSSRQWSLSHLSLR